MFTATQNTRWETMSDWSIHLTVLNTIERYNVHYRLLDMILSMMLFDVIASRNIKIELQSDCDYSYSKGGLNQM